MGASVLPRSLQWLVVVLFLSGTMIARVDCAASNNDKKVLVTCGSVLKLKNEKSKHLLHSLDVNYGSGSGQQAVIGTPTEDSAESMWLVRGPVVKPGNKAVHCPQGTPIAKNMPIRLQHMGTKKWLHSHLFSSPLSNQQEVSCFGSDQQSDTGDVWIVEWDGGEKFWEQDMGVKLKHKDTGAYLSNHMQKYQRPIAGNTEVYASKKTGKEATFKAGEVV
eukprot:jgi/Picsp_1/5901/NSC_03258-R1_stromal cell-derived factor 2 precursor